MKKSKSAAEPDVAAMTVSLDRQATTGLLSDRVSNNPCLFCAVRALAPRKALPPAVASAY
jgi:hypothetical protein